MENGEEILQHKVLVWIRISSGYRKIYGANNGPIKRGGYFISYWIPSQRRELVKLNWKEDTMKKTSNKT